MRVACGHGGSSAGERHSLATQMSGRVRAPVVTIAEVVLVGLGDDGRPAPHGYAEATSGRERVPRQWATGPRPQPA